MKKLDIIIKFLTKYQVGRANLWTGLWILISRRNLFLNRSNNLTNDKTNQWTLIRRNSFLHNWSNIIIHGKESGIFCPS